MRDLASKILMVRPSGFGFNPQTAESNAFQQKSELSPREVSKRAAEEFDRMAEALWDLDVDLVVLEDQGGTDTPDAVFPNNVFSTHAGGAFCIYPMEARARRLERAAVESVLKHFDAKRIIDLTRFEDQGKFLEGTGSLVLDHTNRLAFASLSSRTDIDVLRVWSADMEFDVFPFHATDESGKEIYHSNVMMCLGKGFAVACVESISDLTERKEFVERMVQTRRELVEISYAQMNSFAGNMIQVADKRGNPLLLMSETARRSLTIEQTECLNSHTEIASFDISTIEQCGGGSVRCMIAEVF